MDPVLSLEHLNHSYGETPVLRDVTFSVNPGEFFIIIGPNGSGKTTLLKTICGIEKFQQGNVHILHHPIGHYSRKKLAKILAFVHQLAPVDFPFTVFEVVLMGRSPHTGILGIEQVKDRDIARQAIEFTGVSHLANRKLHQLSSGEQQRVFIAKAICQEPKIMLLDEPTASLDLAHQIRVMDLMEKLRQEKGITVIMVSHDVNLAALYGDRLLLLKEGRIVRQGYPDAVLTFQTLEEAYGCTLLVDENPLGKMPRVTLVPGRFLNKNQ